MFSSKTIRAISCSLLIVQLLLLNYTNGSYSDEKMFESVVSMSFKTLGNPSWSMDQRTVLEQSFKNAYTAMTNSLCSFRVLDDVSLIDLKIKTNNEDENNDSSSTANEDPSTTTTLLNFQMFLKCYDCSDDAKIFDDDSTEGSGHSRSLQVGSACYWNNYDSLSPIDSNNGSTENPVIAPSKEMLLEEIKIIMAEAQLEVLPIDEMTIVENETKLIMVEPMSCPCPKNSFCTYTNVHQKDFWKMPGSPNFLSFNCTCMDGHHSIDGWRCEAVDECIAENNPCDSEGGYCVDTDPNDREHPMFKCGCKKGYTADESSIDIHGARSCEKEYNAIELPSTCPVDVFEREMVLKLTADQESVIEEIELIEQAVKEAYETSIDSFCQYRTLENVTLSKILADDDEVINLTNDNDFDRRLDEEKKDDTILILNGTDSNTTSMESSADLDLADDDDDDITDSDNAVNLSFNFSFFFTMIMRCYGCPEDAQLFDDASRRRRLHLLRGRRLEEEEEDNTNCFCELDNNEFRSRDLEDSTSSASTETTQQRKSVLSGAFLNKLIATLVKLGSKSITKVLSVEDNTDYNDSRNNNEDSKEENGDMNPTVIPGADNDDTNPASDDDGSKNDCLRKCNPTNQFCGDDGLCWCKDGYFSPSGRGGTCRDIPECTNGQAKCHRFADCNEMDGGYSCTCQEGYTGDGKNSCIDIDECENDVCQGERDVCINTSGSYYCVAPTSAPTPAPIPTLKPKPQCSFNAEPCKCPTTVGAGGEEDGEDEASGEEEDGEEDGDDEDGLGGDATIQGFLANTGGNEDACGQCETECEWLNRTCAWQCDFEPNYKCRCSRSASGDGI